MKPRFYETKRPTRFLADEALLRVGGGRLAVRTPGVHPGNVSSNLAPRAISSGPVTAGTETSPCPQPRDWAPRCQTVSNISLFGRFFYRAARSFNMSDWARREHPLSQSANHHHRRPH